MNTWPQACVIDASVGIKIVLEEQYSRQVRDYFSQLLEVPPTMLFVPDLFYTECANILWKYIQRDIISPMLAEQACRVLLQLQLSTTSGMEVMTRTVELAATYKISAYDATYLALADHLHLPLLTADKRLAVAMAHSSYTVIALETVCGAT